MEKLAYSINEAAKVLSLGRTSIYALIAEGRLETLKLGTRRLIHGGIGAAACEGRHDQ
jgi:excisionase family DNA binding protein